MFAREIPESVLADILRVPQATLHAWCLGGRIQSARRGPGKPTAYPLDAVDMFLRGCATEPGQSVTITELWVYELQQRTDSLLLISEAAARLGVPTATALHQFQSGLLPGFALSRTPQQQFREIRIVAWRFAEYAATYKSVTPVRYAGFAFGLARSALLLLISPEGPLVPATPGPNGTANVTTESFTSALASGVRNCTAEEWLALRGAHPEELLLTVEQICTRHKVTEDVLTPLLKQWPHVVTPREGTRQVPEHVVQAWVVTRNSQPPTKPPAKGSETGAPPPAAPPKLRTIEAPRATVVVGTIASTQLASELGMEHAELVQAIKDRILPATELGDGTYTIDQANARAYVRRHERLMGGGDYHLRETSWRG